MSIEALDPTAGTPDGVRGALAQASHATGVDFGYLLATAQRESSLDPSAKSKSSSASGLFQFIEQTWLAALKAHGAEHGFAAQAADIETTASGKLTVADPAERKAILALRNDPGAAAMMAAELTRDSKDQLQKALGRQVSDGELYLAHFFGTTEAGRFIAAASANPADAAATSFPSAAAANPSVFYGANGAPRTLAEVEAHLTGLREDSTQSSDSASSDAELALADAPASSPSMFMGEAPDVATIWTPPAQALNLTPQVLAILASLDPIPDSRMAKDSYQSVLGSQMRS